MPAKAQQIEVKARLEQTTIALGDQTTLVLTAQAPVKSQLLFPELKDTLSSKILIVKTGQTDTVADKNDPATRTITRRYTITSFEPGTHAVPAFTFQEGQTRFTTEILPLQVGTVKVDTTKAIYDIKQPLAVSYTWLDWLRDNWVTVLLVLVAIAVLAGIWYYLKKRPKATVAVQPAQPKDPAHTIALGKLTLLKDKKLWQQGDVKQYHIELSDIVRDYLQERYRINALEQTSDEILSGLKPMDIPTQSMTMLRQLLKLSDLVKFAKEQPLHTENEQSMNNAVDFILYTKELPKLIAKNSENGQS